MKKLPEKKIPTNHKKDLNFISDGAEVFQILEKIISAKKEYEMVKEQETSKRYEIKADLIKHIASVKAQRDSLESYLDREYGLRSEMTKEFLKRLDRALDEDKDKPLPIPNHP